MPLAVCASNHSCSQAKLHLKKNAPGIFPGASSRWIDWPSYLGTSGTSGSSQFKPKFTTSVSPGARLTVTWVGVVV
jgi:hypothetical protein